MRACYIIFSLRIAVYLLDRSKPTKRNNLPVFEYIVKLVIRCVARHIRSLTTNTVGGQYRHSFCIAHTQEVETEAYLNRILMIRHCPPLSNKLERKVMKQIHDMPQERENYPRKHTREDTTIKTIITKQKKK